MYKIDSSGNAAGLFTNGVPGVTPATVVDATWLNAVQTELVNLVQAAGETLDKANSAQVAAAVAWFAGKGYKRDYAPGNDYTTLGAFLAGTFVSLGVEQALSGELCHSRQSSNATADSMLWSIVVNATAGCTCEVICALADNNVQLYLDGTLENTWSLGTSTTPYGLVLSAGTHVIQFLDENSAAATPAQVFLNDWMTGQPVQFLRAARS